MCRNLGNLANEYNIQKTANHFTFLDRGLDIVNGIPKWDPTKILREYMILLGGRNSRKLCLFDAGLGRYSPCYQNDGSLYAQETQNVRVGSLPKPLSQVTKATNNNGHNLSETAQVGLYNVKSPSLCPPGITPTFGDVIALLIHIHLAQKPYFSEQNFTFLFLLRVHIKTWKILRHLYKMVS